MLPAECDRQNQPTESQTTHTAFPAPRIYDQKWVETATPMHYGMHHENTRA